MSTIILKAHNPGYVRGGSFVSPFDDSRPEAKPKAKKVVAPQYGGQGSLFGGSKKPKLNPSGFHKPVDIPSHGVKSPYVGEDNPAGGFFGHKKSKPEMHYKGDDSPGGWLGKWAASLFGGGAQSHGHSYSSKPVYPNKTTHPAPGENGKEFTIYEPSTPTGEETWSDPDAVATFVPGGNAPASLLGTPLLPWDDHPNGDRWDYVAGQMDDLDEPALILTVGMKAASGCIIEEPDGRVWVCSPSNGFGGYDTTFPKGKVEDDLSFQANAIKEVFEETGLRVQITGLAGDFKRSSSVTRLYFAKRIGGSPSAVGWESQAVHLVPKAKLEEVCKHWNDAPIIEKITGVKPTKGWKPPPEKWNGKPAHYPVHGVDDGDEEIPEDW